MKRAVLVFVLAAMVVLSTALFFFSKTNKITTADIVGLGVIALVIGFAVFIGYKRFTSAKRGEPAEDELSKKVMLRTSSLSYYISLYLWLVIMYFSEKLKLEIHTIIGVGILGMAVTFTICWLFFNFRGVRNE
jgi:peptidoglycan/LPS O-acetylase OafA/YrhL